MKIAVLTAGRSGSTSLYNACKLVENYSASHDSGEGMLASGRVILKDQHIAIDTRFAWFLGRLGEADKGDCFYVFLTRDREKIADSYNRRWANAQGIIRGYCQSILQRKKSTNDIEVARDLVDTVEANIRVFIKDRPHCIIRLESWKEDLDKFFAAINAEVDVEKSMLEFSKRHNPSGKVSYFSRARLAISIAVDGLENTLKKMLGR